MLRIYHNPRCSKSRQTLALLAEKGLDIDIIEYLKTPPSEKELRNTLSALGLTPRELLRTKEAEFKEAGLNDMSLSDDAVIQAMLKYPKLIERPIVINGSRAAIGRPPEAVLEIL